MKKLVVITGASSGIGKATARAFSDAGYPTLLLARNTQSIDNLPLSIVRHVDVTDVLSFKTAIQEAEAVYGKADILINNAGMMLLGNAAKQSTEEWNTMLNTNVLGVLNGIHCVLEDMIAREEGTIVNISSIAGRKTFPNHAAYCATKFAVHALSENIREEVAAHKVRVITIAPGVVETNLLSHTSDASIKDAYVDWKNSSMDGRGIDPLYVAQSILFACSMPQNICIRELVIADTRQST